MSDMTSTSNKSRRQVSHEQDLQNTFVLCNIVVNVAVVVADAELRQFECHTRVSSTQKKVC